MLRRELGASGLYYFEDVLPEEFRAINRRRDNQGRERIGPVEPGSLPEFRSKEGGSDLSRSADRSSTGHGEKRPRSPDPYRLFGLGADIGESNGGDGGNGGGNGGGGNGGGGTVDPREPERYKMRPRPVPCDATGLAMSGGGVRSAAVCMGALQSLQQRGKLESLDYVSTVSGGGYMGACLSAAMSEEGGGRFPFGADIADSPAVAHLRNYSNYLMPRGRSGLRNVADATVVILRGLVANAVIVASFVFALAAGTLAAWRVLEPNSAIAPLVVAVALMLALLVWAWMRTYIRLDRLAGDTSGVVLVTARALLFALVLAGVVALQPVAVGWMVDAQSSAGSPWFQGAAASIAAVSGAIAAFAGRIGRFLETSRRAARIRTILLRLISKAVVVVAGLALPAGLWLLYLLLCARGVAGGNLAPIEQMLARWIPGLGPNPSHAAVYAVVALGTGIISLFLRPNAYSLHRFYRDRLSRAFLFRPPDEERADPESLDTLKLSKLRSGHGPYHLINAAMNVQGSVEANRRGRNADFFLFSSRFVGSDLTFYARTAAGSVDTLQMERADPRLDLGAAMAISGAAVSANMGSKTVRVLSPLLALLNVRLGYWMPNPRHLGGTGAIRRGIGKAFRSVTEKLFLLSEMLNLHDETSAHVFLTDGGHIENLGLYELLKRGCRLIVVIDAEADPEMSFSSLLQLERYARIDLGVRIVLPWEEVAESARTVDQAIMRGERPCSFGPHCAVGRITYEDGAEGVLVYFKASLTGDEKDYLIDYKRRNPDFPHETTGDQFFSEEQFEMYRALGFHKVDGFFSGDDDFACKTRWSPDLDEDAVRALVHRLLPSLGERRGL